MTDAASSAVLPIITRHLARSIAGFPTEVLLQVFEDRTLCLITQGKVGRMLQISAPTSESRRHRQQQQERFYNSDDLENPLPLPSDITDDGSSFVPPPPDPSSSLTVLFGSSKSEFLDSIEQVYASHAAAIVFHSSAAAQGQGMQLMQGKPMVVGMGLKMGFLEQAEAGSRDARERFRETMRLVKDVLGTEAIAVGVQ